MTDLLKVPLPTPPWESSPAYRQWCTRCIRHTADSQARGHACAFDNAIARNAHTAQYNRQNLPWFVGSEFSDLQNSVGKDDIRATTSIICDIVEVAAAETPNPAEKIGLAGLEALSAFGGLGVEERADVNIQFS
ncbi:uncharacterized protein RAG0_06320 [Rhynchosporium agropyri]|uniref:Uncharacterized protein n=1 Tax=Rhynchosporium agropyri TaxID=914238 RepID=A0A1E1KGI3_9HELO|nr:uncharacterized protein RAG0_06320 [Rhynchosporium agropyri]